MNDVTDILEKYPCIMNEQTLRGRVRRVEEVTQPSTSSYCYSHVIPYDLIVSLQAALDNFTICRQKERNARHEMPEVVDLTSTLSSADDKTLAVWVTPQPKPFSSERVHTMKTFYRIKKSCNWWARDMDWLNQD
ncbi:hypothetical protein JG687_00014151 [Phytophthora cactorum]|uniref:Uncharacterized protein n=1 Tax=Phytophthora cactorum TaxID=29920 RepID=A0A8T1TXM1_9STRA|nr:hypothetical protein JG687_00014151 [Phytophthora cactorum]